MFGKVDAQINRLIKMTGIKASKNESKRDERMTIREEFRKANGKFPTSHELNKETRIFAQKTLENTRSTWLDFGNFLREKGIKDIEKATNRQVEKYLIAVIDKGVTHKEFQNVCSRLTKLESALNTYAGEKTHSFDKAISFVKPIAEVHLEKDIEARAYQRPAELIQAISNEKFRICAEVMHQGGARINEAGMIDEKRLGGFRNDAVRGEVGVIKLDGADTKGGKARDLIISKETYQKLESYIKENGKFNIGRNNGERQKLREDIKQAAAITGQKYTGAHGLRHCYAQERVSEKENVQGKSYLNAISEVSKEMGHERPSITEHYLRSAA